MIRLLGLVVAILIVLAIAGYFRGWFHAGSHSADGHETVTVTVDKDKLEQDKAAAEQRLRNMGSK